MKSTRIGNPESPEIEGIFKNVFPGTGKIARFQSLLVGWFRETGRDYPWRNTIDPYAVLVSELMLQQTRIATVLERGYFERWMTLFPDVETLASAEESRILKTWEGLGYYNRARNLQKAARKVAEEYGGIFPNSLEEIEALPGVGRYTAGAVVSFAYGRRAPIVDGNVVRVLSRILGYDQPIDTSGAIKAFWDWADRLTPDSEVRDYNSGIMELGQQVCVRSSPSCEKCPVRSICLASAQGKSDVIPRKKEKAEVVRKIEKVGILVNQGEILLAEERGSRRIGLWKLPEVTGEQAADWEELFRFPYSITRYRVELVVYRAVGKVLAEVAEGSKWYPLKDGENLPALGSPYRKAIEKYLDIRDDLTMNR